MFALCFGELTERNVLERTDTEGEARTAAVNYLVDIHGEDELTDDVPPELWLNVYNTETGERIASI